MWHKEEPDARKVIDEFKKFDFAEYDELIYCGYGEPTCALEVLLETAKYFKSHYSQKIRLNTNGLGRIYNKRDILPELNQVIDAYSISLNAPNKERYNEVVRPMSDSGFDEMLKFAKDCRKAGKEVQLSVVTYINDREVQECRKLAEELRVPIKVRTFVEG
jgi:TatD family-associated radical SAM protein